MQAENVQWKEAAQALYTEATSTILSKIVWYEIYHLTRGTKRHSWAERIFLFTIAEIARLLSLDSANVAKLLWAAFRHTRAPPCILSPSCYVEIES